MKTFTWWEVVHYSFEIRPVEVTRSSEESIWVPCGSKDRRQARVSTWSRVFESKEKAQQYARDLLVKRIAAVRHELESLESKLKSLNAEAR